MVLAECGVGRVLTAVLAELPTAVLAECPLRCWQSAHCGVGRVPTGLGTPETAAALGASIDQRCSRQGAETRKRKRNNHFCGDVDNAAVLTSCGWLGIRGGGDTGDASAEPRHCTVLACRRIHAGSAQLNLTAPTD